MSNRFHNKFHRHNHHTRPTDREGLFPDSAYDPIASKESPFQGEFFLDGNLTSLSSVSASYGIYGTDGLFHGNMTIEGNLFVLGDTTMLDTMVYSSSAIEVLGNFQNIPLKVSQSGNNYISEFTGFQGDNIIFDQYANVGIGRVPRDKLDVAGTVRSMGLYVRSNTRDLLIVNENTGQIGIGVGLSKLIDGFVTLSSDPLYEWLIQGYSTNPTGGGIYLETNSGNSQTDMVVKFGPNVFDNGDFGIGTDTANSISIRTNSSERIRVEETNISMRGPVNIKGAGAALNVYNVTSTNYYRINNIGSSGQSNAALSFVHSTVGDVLHLSQTGQIGIRTTSPTAQIHIKREAGDTGTDTGITLDDNVSLHNWYIGATNISYHEVDSSLGQFVFKNSVKELLRIDNEGHIGIGGMANPPYSLTINSTLGNNNPSTPVIALLENGTLATTISQSNAGSVVNTIIGALGDLILSPTFVEKARFTTNGSFLLGTTSSNFSKINIYSDFSQTSAIRIQDTNPAYPKTWTIGPRNGSFVLTDENSPRIVVGTTGNIGIGTNVPEHLLHVEGAVAVKGSNAEVLFYNSNGSNFYELKNTGSPGNGNAELIFSDSSFGERMKLSKQGYLGIGTSAPNTLLTVAGQISSANIVWALAGNSMNWNSVYSSVANTSANWNSVYSSVANTSANWNSVYSSVANTSADWDSVYSSVENTSADWDSVYSSVENTSADWDSVYSSVLNTSANWDSVYSYIQNTSANDLNSITMLEAISANWDSVYSYVQGISANDLNSITMLEAISANWNSVYSYVQGISANDLNSLTKLESVSSIWDNTYSSVRSTSANWNAAYTAGFDSTSVYSTVRAQSATWNTGGAVTTLTQNNSASWLNTTSTVNSLSGSWGAPFNVPNPVNATFTTGTLVLPTGGGAGVDHTILGTAATDTIAITAVTGGINTITYVLTNKTNKPIQFFYGPKLNFRRGNGWKSNTTSMSGAYLNLPLSASCNMRATDAGTEQFVSIW